MKKTLIGLGIAAIIAGSFLSANALTCTNNFPTSLNGFSSSSCIASSWGNALEQKMGIRGSTATSSLDYQINHIFTSYGSELIATSALPYVGQSPISISPTGSILFTNPGYITATSTAFLWRANNGSDILSTSTFRSNLGLTDTGLLASSTWYKVVNNGSDITSTSTFRSNLGLTDTGLLASSTWFKVANNLSEGTASTMRTNLGLGVFATQSAPCSVSQGCTGATSFSRGVLIASGTTAFASLSGTNGQSLIASSTAPTGFAFQTVSASSLPGGSDTEIQYNKAGVFAGDPGLVYDDVSKRITLSDSLILDGSGIRNSGQALDIKPGIISGNGQDLTLSGGNSTSGDGNGGNLYLQAGSPDGAGVDGKLGIFTSSLAVGFANLSNELLTSTDRDFKFPDQSGILALVLTATSTSIGGGSLTAGTCATATTTVIGALPTMTVQVTPATTTNVGNSAFWKGYISNNDEVTTKVCESVLGTPVATSYNIRVTQ